MRIGSLSACLAVLSLMVTFCARAEKAAFTAAFQDLAKEDQVEFVRAVNVSMATYKASSQKRRLQTIYAVNRDAVVSSSAKVKKSVIAEVFATASADVLPQIVDGFAEELFNRKAAGFSERDDSFVEFAAATLMRVRNRLAQLPADQRPGVRSALAAICFLKASGGQPPDLKDAFLLFVLDGARETARKEWIPAALGQEGKEPTLQPVLEALVRDGVADAKPADAKPADAKPADAPRSATGTDSVGSDATRTSRRRNVESKSPWYSRRRGDKPVEEDDGYMGQGL